MILSAASSQPEDASWGMKLKGKMKHLCFHPSGSSLGNSSSSHIRFDSDDDDAEDQQGGTTSSNITDSFSEAKLNTATKGGQIKSADETISCKDVEVKVIMNKFFLRK